MTNINPLIFRAYDIRGFAMTPPGTNKAPDLNPEIMENIGKGIGTYMIRTYKTKNMLIGRDNRLHGESLQKAFIKGILSTGIDVIDAGVSTSPLIYYTVCRQGYDSGVNITASHNPKEYNGVKIVRDNAHSVCGDELQLILKLIQNEDFDSGNGSYSSKNHNFEAYIEDMKSKMKLKRPLKVVIDAGNGTAGMFAPALLRALGADVTELFCEPDGNYPNHEANPEEERNMLDLGAKVREIGADIGIGFDGDGDRVGIVDEKGKHYTADYTILFLARELLEKQPGSQVVFDVKVSKVIINEIERLSGIPVMSKVGHSFIETRMHELNAPFAGELSGHFFFNKTHYGYYGFDDALFAACKILEVLSSSDKKYSEHFDDLPKMETSPEYKAPCPDDKKDAIVKKITDHFTREHQCITIDGVRVNFDDVSWGAVRSSNTSPNLTIRFEAPTKERLSQIQKIMIDELRKYPDVNLSWYKET